MGAAWKRAAREASRGKPPSHAILAELLRPVRVNLMCTRCGSEIGLAKRYFP